MQSTHTTTRTGALPVGPQAISRDRQSLLDALAVIDGEGWDCPTATALLTYIRSELIRPLTIDTGLRGGAASEGEATAWEAVWLKLCDPHLRSAVPTACRSSPARLARSRVVALSVASRTSCSVSTPKNDPTTVGALSPKACKMVRRAPSSQPPGQHGRRCPPSRLTVGAG